MKEAIEPMLRAMEQLADVHPIIAVLLFVLVRALAIVIPPIQGIVVDAAGVAAFGGFRAFVYAECGVMLGAGAAFFTSRWARPSLAKRWPRFFERIESHENRLEKRESFATWFLLRLVSNPAFDYLSYAAGLTTCSFRLFFASTLFGNMPTMALVFAALAMARESPGLGTFFILLGVLGLLFIAWRVYRR